MDCGETFNADKKQEKSDGVGGFHIKINTKIGGDHDKGTLDLSDTKNFLLDVNQFYLKGRYPEEKSEFYKICTPEFARENFNAIKDFYQWLLKQF